MEVIKTNFKAHMQKFRACLEEASFVSLDLEFTGVPREIALHTETPMEHYHKQIVCANKCKIIQLGLSIFIKDDDLTTDIAEHYNAHTFVFYLFPSTHNGRINQEVVMELSSIEYNVKAGGVDFNKWICQGIPYFNKKQQAQLKNAIYRNRILELNDYSKIDQQGVKKEKANGDTNGEELFYDKEHFKEVEKQIEAFCEWAKTAEEGTVFKLDETKFFAKRYFLERVKSMSLDSFKNILILEEKTENDRYLYTFTKCSQDYKLNHLKEIFSSLDKEYEEALGFSYVWELIKVCIAQKKIPLVGHQCFLDFMYLMSHLENRLPNNYVQFKKELSETFPLIYDTKNMSRILGLDNHLEELYFKCRGLEPAPRPVKYKLANQENIDVAFVAHNAGYDAYITGAVFLELQARLPNWQNQANILNIFRNKFYLCDLKNQKDSTRSEHTVVFHPKKQEASDLLTKGVVKENFKALTAQEDEKKDKFVKGLTELCAKGLENSFALFSHRHLPIYGNERCYFVRFDKLHNMDILIDKYGSDFTILTLEEHFDKMLSFFQENVYQAAKF